MQKILLVEDGDDHARVLIAVLKRSGYDVHRCSDGVEAYEYLVANPMPDLLITDVMMPGMSGFELLGRIKSENIMPPTIVLTGRQREEDIIQGLNYGVLDYLTKPFSPTVVLAKVKNILRQSNEAS